MSRFRYNLLLFCCIFIVLFIPNPGYTDAQWVQMGSPTSAMLHTIWGTSGNNVFALGSTPGSNATIIHYDGNKWVKLFDDDTNYLSAVRGSSKDNIFALGYNGSWAVYLPGESDGGTAYAQSKGFTVLSNINPGEGFWVNCTEDITLN